MLVQTVPVAEWHFPLLQWGSVASTGPWCHLCYYLAAPPSSTLLCAHGWCQLQGFLRRQQCYTKAMRLFEVWNKPANHPFIQGLRMWWNKASGKYCTFCTMGQIFCSYLFLHNMKHSWSSLLSQTPQSRPVTKHSCHLAPGPTACKNTGAGH